MSEPVIWNHIGLHGHSVGTFACDEGGLKWKSAILGREDEAVSSSTKNLPKDAIGSAHWTVFGKSGHLRIQTFPSAKLHHEFRFDGFPPNDFEKLKETFKEKYDVELQKYNLSAAGTQFGLSSMNGKKLTFRHCILEDADEEGEEFEPRESDEMMSLDLAEVSQCVLPGNNRNEIELQFPESDAVEANNDQLVSIRFYIPPDPEADPADRTVKTAAELLQQRIMSTANIRKTTGDVIVEFDHDKGSFLTPRGRYSIELYHRFFRMRGQKYDYKIKYDDISRLFLLPKPDEVHMAFVIALDKPIRQGQQRYQHLVLQTSKDPDEVTVNMDEETLKKEYGDDLQPVMRGSLSNLVAKTFKVIAKKKVFIPGKFSNAHQQPCVKCALRANEGLLYPLEKQFVFIHKPPILVRFSEVDSVEFQRYAGGQGSTRNFDLCVTLKEAASMGTQQQEYVFSGIDRSDYAGLYNFLSGKNIRIKNLQENILDEPQRLTLNEDEIYGGPDDELGEESEDEDYDEKAAAADVGGGGSGSDSDDDIDDDELGSEIDEDLDSDLEEARGGDGQNKKKRPANDSDEDDEDDDVPKKKKAKKGKSSSESNTPKQARSAFMFYSSSVRKQVAKDNPDADKSQINKIIASDFKKLSASERQVWEAKAKKDKKRYAAEMEGNQDDDDDDDDEDDDDTGKKKGKKKKDPNAPKKPTTAYFYFMQENRAKIKEANPDLDFGDIARKVSSVYKELDDSEKAKYEEKAAADKERYKKEMANYTPPPASESASKGKKSRKKKDPNAPKKPTTAFMVFNQKNRSRIQKENPELGFGDIGKLLGEKYRNLTPEERAKYDAMVEADKKRYAAEMKEYKKKGSGDNNDSDGMDEDQDDDDDDESE